MEEAQNNKFKMQVKELENAQRKFNEKQRKFFIGQQEQEGATKKTQSEEKSTKTGRLEDLLIEIDDKFTQEEAANSPSNMNRLFAACQVAESKKNQRDPSHEYSHD